MQGADRTEGAAWAISAWCSDHSGPRERSSSRVTTRSPSLRSERAPSRAMRGSEPGSSRSPSLNTRSGTYSGPEDLQRHAPGLLAIPESQRDLLRETTSRMRAWG